VRVRSVRSLAVAARKERIRLASLASKVHQVTP